MRKLTLLALAVVAVALPLEAVESRHQSYISYDDGNTLVRTPDDQRPIEARVNLPLFPGDELITDRRGRTEIHLADGNVLGVDRATAIRLQSVLDSYDGDASETVVELRYGKVAVYRVRDTRDHFRLDTPSATYFASNEAIFSVETDSRGRDRVSVLDGAIEIRTPARSTRLRTGEQADIDERGLYDVAGYSRNSADDFERWFLQRSERYGAQTSRYLDDSLAYYEDELTRHGSWVHTSHYGWAWRPSVGAGWRPYHNGYWMRGRSGCLTWVSHEPWGWVPYHYGRWSFDPHYGWFWVPGVGYAPAWVYWWYGNGYMGWAPAGYWDLYRPYYPWAYQPYHRAGLSIGFGFYGRVRVREVDLDPWTFVDANTIVSHRADRAALTTDAVRERLARDRGGFATISSDPARFTREEFRDPAAAINRRWVGVDTGRAGAGPANEPPIDVTPFIRRDGDLPGAVRERVTRNRPSRGSTPETTRTLVGGSYGGTVGGGGVAPIGGSVAPIGGGNLAPVGGGSVAPIGGSSGNGSGTRVAPPADAARDRINRGGVGGRTTVPRVVPRDDAPAAGAGRDSDAAGRVRRGGNTPDRSEQRTDPATWRDRVGRSAPPQDEPQVTVPAAPPAAPARDSDWRSRIARPGDSTSGRTDTPPPSASRTGSTGRDVPRRVIDRIGGARVQSGSRTRSTSSGSSRGERSTPTPRSVDRPSSSSSSGSSSPPPRASGGSSRSAGSSGSRESGGRIKKDQ